MVIQSLFDLVNNDIGQCPRGRHSELTDAALCRAPDTGTRTRRARRGRVAIVKGVSTGPGTVPVVKIGPGMLLLTRFLAAAPPDKPDGSAGTPPALLEYLGVASGPSVGFDYHTVFGLGTRDGGSLTVGTGLKREDADELFDGVAIKLGQCAAYPSQFELIPADSPSPSGCGVQWVHRIQSKDQSKSAQLLWAAEAPDGSYAIVAGLVWVDRAYSRYLAKLNATTGHKIWEWLPGSERDAGSTYEGFESVSFTKDGGLIASGFVGASAEPHFKSSGQVEDGRPNVIKISASQVAASSAPLAPQWSYTSRHDEDAYIGSAKVVREEESTGHVVAIVGTGAAIVYLTAGGEEAAVADVAAHGQASDFALVPGGLLLSGLRGSQSTTVCPDGCTYVAGRLSYVTLGITRIELQWSRSYGNPPGGKYQFAGLPKGPDELIYNECWGVQPTTNASGAVDGAVMACGTGIEGCDTAGLTPALIAQCKSDPRTTWRAMTIAADLAGELTWRRVDSFKPEGESTVGTSAAEYVFLTASGAPVLVTDEGFGAGWVMLK